MKQSYTVESHKYGMVIKGAIPVDDFVNITKAWADRGLDTVVPGVASALGATLACCAKADVEAWMEEVKTAAKEKAHGDAELEWLLGPDTGIASKTIFGVLSARHGIKIGIRWATVPGDPEDFGRCHRLLEAFTEWRSRLPEVAANYAVWVPLIREWERLTLLYLEELPSGRCPKLYDEMHTLIEEGKRSSQDDRTNKPDTQRD